MAQFSTVVDTEIRSQLYTGADNETLFLTHLGEAFTPARMSQLARTVINKADINKTGSCHLFRHTMVTVMLENGADIRYIQEMLGHAKIDTTQIYTQVSIRRLKQVHDLTHSAGSEKSGQEPDSNP